jgi:hypothetical protein
LGNLIKTVYRISCTVFFLLKVIKFVFRVTLGEDHKKPVILVGNKVEIISVLFSVADPNGFVLDPQPTYEKKYADPDPDPALCKFCTNVCCLLKKWPIKLSEFLTENLSHVY